MIRVAFDVRPLQISSGQRGIGSYVKGLLKQYAERSDISLKLMHWGKNVPELKELTEKNSSIDTIEVPKTLDLPVLKNFGFFYEGTDCRKFYRRLSSEADLVHFTSPQEVIYGFPWFNIGIPRVLTVHDIMSVTCPDLVYPKFDPVRKAFSRTLHRMLLSQYIRADYFICDSEFTLSELKRYFKGRKILGKSVLLGADKKSVQASERLKEAERIKQKYSLPESYFLYVGGLAGNKNVKILLQALEGSSLGSVCLAGPYSESDLNELKSQAPNTKVISLGYIPKEDLAGLYSGAVCFVFPSLMEGFGLPVIEAMADGVPVLCSKASSLPEVGGDAVLYFDPRSSEELKDLLVRISSDHELRETLIKKGLERAFEFTWQRCASETIETYRQICADFKA